MIFSNFFQTITLKYELFLEKSYISAQGAGNEPKTRIVKPALTDRCGLCKRTNSECYAAKGWPLGQTNCCGNLFL